MIRVGHWVDYEPPNDDQIPSSNVFHPVFSSMIITRILHVSLSVSHSDRSDDY